MKLKVIKPKPSLSLYILAISLITFYSIITVSLSSSNLNITSSNNNHDTIHLHSDIDSILKSKLDTNSKILDSIDQYKKLLETQQKLILEELSLNNVNLSALSSKEELDKSKTNDSYYYSDISQESNHKNYNSNNLLISNNYDISNRIVLLSQLGKKYDISDYKNYISDKNNILSFVLFNYRPFVKLDSGFFTGKLVLVIYDNNYLAIHDERNTLLFYEKLSSKFQAIKLLNFGLNDEQEFYILGKYHENDNKSKNNDDGINNYVIIKYQLDFYSRSRLLMNLEEKDQYSNKNNTKTKTNKMQNSNIETNNDKNNKNKKAYDSFSEENKNVYNTYILDKANENKGNSSDTSSNEQETLLDSLKVILSNPFDNMNHRTLKVKSYKELHKENFSNDYEINFHFDKNRERNVFILKEIARLNLSEEINKINSSQNNDIDNTTNTTSSFSKNIIENSLSNIKLHVSRGKRLILLENTRNIFILKEDLSIMNVYARNNYLDIYKQYISRDNSENSDNNNSKLDNHLISEDTILNNNDFIPFLNYIGFIYQYSPIFHIFGLDNLNELLISIDLNDLSRYECVVCGEVKQYSGTVVNTDTNTNRNRKDSDFFYYNKNEIYTNNIISFTFDQFNSLLYFLTEELNLFIISIKINTNNKNINNTYSVLMIIDIKNYLQHTSDNIISRIKNMSKTKSYYKCKFLVKFNSSNNDESCNFINTEVIRKDLFIKIDNELVIIDLEPYANINESFNQLPRIQYKNLNVFDNNYNEEDVNRKKSKFSEFQYIRNSHGNYIAMKHEVYSHITNSTFSTDSTDDNTYSDVHSYILLYEVALPNSSFMGTEEFSFNFKIPIIFIALIILLIYHLATRGKNKKVMSEEEQRKVREDLIQQLKKEGVNLESRGKSKNNVNSKDIDKEYDNDDINILSKNKIINNIKNLSGDGNIDNLEGIRNIRDIRNIRNETNKDFNSNSRIGKDFSKDYQSYMDNNKSDINDYEDEEDLNRYNDINENDIIGDDEYLDENDINYNEFEEIEDDDNYIEDNYDEED